jgi:hypothetical protein
MSTIQSSAEHLTLNADGSSKDIKFQANGVEKASISSAGVISSDGGSTHADNVKAKFGTGDDLEIYHDGSDSIIKDAGTGNLKILAEDFRLQNADGTEQMIRADQDGAVDLYHNNVKKLETTAAGVTVTGSTAHTEGSITNTISGTYKLFGANGTAGAPAYCTYAFEGDDNTGMYSGTADTIKFATGGTERMRLTSDGRGLSQFTAKAWVNYNQDGNSIVDSHNISSATDTNTGNFVITLSNAMANTNYCPVTTAGGNSGSNGDESFNVILSDSTSTTTTTFRSRERDGSPNTTDNLINAIVWFGD